MKNRLLISGIIVVLTFTGCSFGIKDKQNLDDSSIETIVDEEKNDTIDATSETSSSDAVKQANDVAQTMVGPSGKYSAIFTEVIDGEAVTYDVSYTFNSDGTGVYDGQDTIDFTWDAENEYVYMNDYKYPFVLNDNCISISEYQGIQDYYKQEN